MPYTDQSVDERITHVKEFHSTNALQFALNILTSIHRGGVSLFPAL